MVILPQIIHQKQEEHPTMNGTKFTLESDGRISVPNLSAYWLPDLTIKEVIKGSTYTISGEYVGTECIVPKLKRIMAHDAVELMKEANHTADDEENEKAQESEEDLHDKSAE